MQPDPISRLKRTRLGLLASALGLCLLLLGGREAAGLRIRLSPANLLIGAREVLRAPDGTVLVVSDLARVHVYSAEGRPLRGFRVPAPRFRVHVAGPDRLLVLPDAGAPLAFDFAGEPAAAPTPAELASAAEPATPSGGGLRIEDGNVLRVGLDGERVWIRGYPSHGAMLAHVLLAGSCLFAGGVLLVGGVLATGRRAEA